MVRTTIVALATFANAANASFLAGDALDQAADVLAWVVLALVPIVGISLFWIVHVLPEKIAHKRHHPQTQAIQTLCLLSLVFGGMLWPFAWLWAFTKPVGYKLAYGTDRSDDYFIERGEKARTGELTREELTRLRAELDAVHARGVANPELAQLRDHVARLAAAASPGAAGTAEPERRSA
jgi:CBS domain containing-hemolysin-like protein